MAEVLSVTGSGTGLELSTREPHDVGGFAVGCAAPLPTGDA